MSSNYVAYYRVSTAGQARSGLGLDAQRQAVSAYQSGRGRLLAEFTEVESGKQDSRPQLRAALALCDLTGATLLVAKLDRLSRNVAFLAALQDSGARFIAADMPEANELTIHIMAAVAQAERKAISESTKAALAAAKARGTRLGGRRSNICDLRKGPIASAKSRSHEAQKRALKVFAHVQIARNDGANSLREIATALDSRGITAPRGGTWSASQVRSILKRAEYKQADQSVSGSSSSAGATDGAFSSS